MPTQNTLRLGLVLAVILVFGNSLKGEFLLWDDTQHILLNSHLRGLDFSYFWQNPCYGFFIPLTYNLWTALFFVSDQPFVFHLTNLILHSANVLMVFEFLNRLQKTDPRFAFLGALVFALHPLQVEPIAWISGARDLLSSFFGLLALLIVTSSSIKTFSTRGLVATILFALGLLSKPSLAALPIAFLLMDYLRPITERQSRRLLMIWSGLGAGLLVYTLNLQATFSDPRLEASFFERTLFAIDSLGFYLRALVVPWPLSFSYDRTIEKILSDRLYLYALATVFGALVGISLLANKFGRAVYGYALFSITMLMPILGLIPFAGQVQSTVFDRYMYLPMLGVAFIVSTVVKIKELRYLVVASIIAMIMISTTRTLDWNNNRSLSESALAEQAHNYIALTNLGIVELELRNYVQAENHLRKAWQSRPKEALAPANLAHVLWLKNDVGGILQEIKPLTEDDSFLHYNQREIEALALLFRMKARAYHATLDQARAKEAYLRALEYRPDDLELHQEFALFQREN